MDTFVVWPKSAATPRNALVLTIHYNNYYYVCFAVSSLIVAAHQVSRMHTFCHLLLPLYSWFIVQCANKGAQTRTLSYFIVIVISFWFWFCLFASSSAKPMGLAMPSAINHRFEPFYLHVLPSFRPCPVRWTWALLFFVWHFVFVFISWSNEPCYYFLISASIAWWEQVEISMLFTKVNFNAYWNCFKNIFFPSKEF